MEIERTNEETILSVGEIFYKKHKERVSRYQKANPQKMRDKCKRYNDRFRDQRPEEYMLLLESKRKYYQEVTKPKREAIKEANALLLSSN
jgi:hypothetical protein